MWRWLNSLQARLTLLLTLASIAGALIYSGVTQWPLPQLLVWQQTELTVKDPSSTTAAVSKVAPVTHLGIYGALGICLVLLLLLAFWLAGQAMAPVSRLLRALEGAVASYRDGDFSISIGIHRRDELGELIQMHNALGQTLREQRQNLAQRELLLDTVVQNTPVALVLTDSIGRVAYANIASRHLFNEGRSLHGLEFARLLDGAPEALRRAVEDGEDALLSVEMDGSEETFHISQRAFRLQGRPHRSDAWWPGHSLSTKCTGPGPQRGRSRCWPGGRSCHRPRDRDYQNRRGLYGER